MKSLSHEMRTVREIIEAGLATVDHREDLVRLRMADEAVGRLAVEGAEVRLAVDDGRAALGLPARYDLAIHGDVLLQRADPLT